MVGKRERKVFQKASCGWEITLEGKLVQTWIIRQPLEEILRLVYTVG